MGGENLKDLLRQALDNGDEIYGIPGTVIAVDMDAKECDVKPLDGSAEILGVKLKADDKESSGVVYKPKIGSFVTVVMVSKEDGFIGMWSEIDEATIDIAKITYNGGENGGLIINSKLITEIAKVSAFMDIIKNTFGSAVPVPNDGGAAIQLAFNTALTSMEKPDLSGITNDNIKH